MKLANALNMARQLLAGRLAVARRAVDATAGNGHDALYLAECMPPGSSIWAFDIQQAALENTGKLLADHGLAGRVTLLRACHSRMAEYVAAPLDVAMFNLGYLPGASHALVTRAATTVEALRQTALLLGPGGLATIVAYPGHPSGNEERIAVENFLSALPQAAFTVACWQMLNQIHNPPVLYILEKRGGTP